MQAKILKHKRRTTKKKKKLKMQKQKLNMNFFEKIDTKVERKQRIVWFSGSRDEKRVNEKDSNRKIPMRVKSNIEVFEMIQTHEILSKSNFSEVEENKAKFVTIIMDLFYIYNGERDGNCLFRAISILTNGIPDNHKEIR